MLQVRGIKLFAVVDHHAEAIAAGLELRPTMLVIFGSPKCRHSDHASQSDGCHRFAVEAPGLDR